MPPSNPATPSHNLHNAWWCACGWSVLAGYTDAAASLRGANPLLVGAATHAKKKLRLAAGAHASDRHTLAREHAASVAARKQRYAAAAKALEQQFLAESKAGKQRHAAAMSALKQQHEAKTEGLESTAAALQQEVDSLSTADLGQQLPLPGSVVSQSAGHVCRSIVSIVHCLYDPTPQTFALL